MAIKYTTKKTIEITPNTLVHGAKATKRKITLGDYEFSVYKTPKGAYYIVGETAEGRLYPVWIGTKARKQWHGCVTRRYKKGTIGIIFLTERNTPYVKYLKSFQLLEYNKHVRRT